MVDELRERFPRLAELMDGAREDVLAYMTFPREHWREVALSAATGSPSKLPFCADASPKSLREMMAPSSSSLGHDAPQATPRGV